MNFNFSTGRKVKTAIVLSLLLVTWHIVSKRYEENEATIVLPSGSGAVVTDEVATALVLTSTAEQEFAALTTPVPVQFSESNSQTFPSAESHFSGTLFQQTPQTPRIETSNDLLEREFLPADRPGLERFSPVPAVAHTPSTPLRIPDAGHGAKFATGQGTKFVIGHAGDIGESHSEAAIDESNSAPRDLVVDHKVRTVTLTTKPLPDGPSTGTQGTTEYILASQPKIGDRYKSETPVFDRLASETFANVGDFSPDPIDPSYPYDPYLNQQVYEGKTLNANQRPLLELGQPWYQLGQLSPGSSLLGHHNNLNPQFLIFGDYRQAYASNTVNGDNVSQVAFQLNTFWSLFLTGTERLVTGVSPLTKGGRNTRVLLDDDFVDLETDFDFDFGYLEGDLGAITGGAIGKTLPFDLPFSIGLTPIFIQNGIWINDALEGVFFTLPARNSPRFNISNMDVTFAFIHDQIDSAAFAGDNSAAKAYAAFLFIEALNGYIEADYAFLEDRDRLNRSYHNIALAYTRRFGRFISHSTRVIANAGQNVSAGEQTADGVLLLSENSLITRNPYTVIPYFNFFAGFDRPQSFAGDQELTNTGILFESDALTGYPTLDTRAQDTYGYAVGLNLLAQDFSQQLILETAAVFRNDDSDLAGDQFGVGMRYQLPISNSWIFRTDGMYGFFRGDDDDFGMRVEMRKKF